MKIRLVSTPPAPIMRRVRFRHYFPRKTKEDIRAISDPALRAIHIERRRTRPYGTDSMALACGHTISVPRRTPKVLYTELGCRPCAVRMQELNERYEHSATKNAKRRQREDEVQDMAKRKADASSSVYKFVGEPKRVPRATSKKGYLLAALRKVKQGSVIKIVEAATKLGLKANKTADADRQLSYLVKRGAAKLVSDGAVAKKDAPKTSAKAATAKKKVKPVAKKTADPPKSLKKKAEKPAKAAEPEDEDKDELDEDDDVDSDDEDEDDEDEKDDD